MSDARASGLDVNIDELLEKVRKEKHQGKKLDLFEELLANTEIASLEPADPRRVKLKMHYQKAIMDYAKELQQLADHFASQLTDLENTSDKDVPPSHQSMITAYDNLANYLIQDILNKPTFEQQLLAYKRWIQVLKHSLEDCHDYHSASASINGLNSAAISKMKTLHKHLSDDEQQFIDKISHSFPVDQGWALMQARLDNQEPFTPNLGGIKKTIAKANEAKKTHEMEASFLGKKIKETSLQNNKIPIINQLTESLRNKKQNTTFTDLQNTIAPAHGTNPNQITPLGIDENSLFECATHFEMEHLESILRKWQAELAKLVAQLLVAKRPPEPAKSVKKKIKNQKLTSDEIIAPNFIASDKFTQLLDAITTIEIKSKKATDASLLGARIIQLTKDIDQFHKRRDRLARDSTASTGSTISAISSALSSDSQPSLSTSTASTSSSDDSRAVSDSGSEHEKKAKDERKHEAHKLGLARGSVLARRPTSSALPPVTPRASSSPAKPNGETANQETSRIKDDHPKKKPERTLSKGSLLSRSSRSLKESFGQSPTSPRKPGKDK